MHLQYVKEFTQPILHEMEKTTILQEAQPFSLVAFSIGKNYTDVNYKKYTLY